MPPEARIHPMIGSDELIKERGLMVFDDIHQMPVYNEPFIAPYVSISLNLRGWVELEYDMRPKRFQANDIAVVHANHTICTHRSSDDYHAMLLVLSPRMVEEMKNLTPSLFIDFYHYVWQPDFQLTDEQAANIVHIMQLLKSTCLSEMQNREAVLRGLLHILVIFMQDYRHNNGHSDLPLSPRQELFVRFHQAITQYFRKNREVRFYANLFCLTPKHFATVIKQQTGINASDWISNYVMIQAKSMLRDRRQLSIQQIASQLGFSDQAAFSRYFKSNEGLSPSEFREQH